MAKGNVLENLLTQATKNYGRGIALHRIRDGHDYGVYDRHKSPADFFGHCMGYPLLVEAKETQKPKFYVSDLQRRDHQLKALRDWAQSHERAIAGHVLYFKKQQRIAFLPIEHFPMILKTIELDTPGIRIHHVLGTDWEYLFCGEIHSKRPVLHSNGG